MVWQPSVPSLRRRSVVLGATTTGFVLTFNYNVSCLASNTACQTQSTGSTLYVSTNSALNNAFNAFNLALGPCQILGSTAGFYIFNTTCLDATAATYCGSLVAIGVDSFTARNNTADFLYNLTVCGTQPAFPNGTCLDSSYTTTAIANSSSIANSCSCVNLASASSSGGGGGGLGMAAGAAAGGIILIVIIIIVLLRRRRNVGAKSSKGSKVWAIFTIIFLCYCLLVSHSDSNLNSMRVTAMSWLSRIRCTTTTRFVCDTITFLTE